MSPGGPEFTPSPDKVKLPEKPFVESGEFKASPEVVEQSPQAPQQVAHNVSLPKPTQVHLTDDAQAVASDPVQNAAADSDVIEKEWVKRAKKIVNLTRNDPHEQEKEVSKLQAEYIKRRYGKDIKVAGGS